MTLSVWLRAARPADGGLLVPARPTRGACDLLITPGGVDILADDLRVHLPFEHCGALEGDRWILTPWAFSRGGEDIGVAVLGGGCHAAGIAQLRRRRRTLANWINQFGSGRKDAPLYAASTINTRVEADLAALGTLCQTLAAKPEWRPQLGDPGCVEEFLNDMATTDHQRLALKTGATRRSMETLLAMHLLDYEHHPDGRPLPDAARPDGEAVIGAVLRRLEANPYALPADEPHVRALVHRRYLDIEPWPFNAFMPKTAAHT